MRKIRWGLLSTANINQKLIPAIRQSAQGKLTAVASRDPAKATAYATKWDIPQTFASYEALLQSDAIDAVYISLPNHLHATWTIYALRQGKHVLCEKPFALTLAEVDAVSTAVQETGYLAAEAFMYRHHPQTKLVGDWVHNGRLGQITLVRGTFNFRFRSRDNIRLVPAWGGGCLWDVGVYPLSFAQFIYGTAPQWVVGSQWLGDTGVDEDFAAQMTYPHGGVAQISASFHTPWHTALEIIGTEGRLSLTRPFVGLEHPERHLTFYPSQGDPQEIPVPDVELYLGQVEDLHTAILDGTPPYLSLAETRQHIHTTLALYESAQTHQVVHLS